MTGNIGNMNQQQFSLRWNNYTSYIAGAFDALRYEEDLVDVTLCCEGRKIRAHKVLLSACSPYFKDVFKENPCQHPVIIFKNVRYVDLMSLVEFMYQGEVSVPQEQLPSFLHTAEILAVRGLTDNSGDSRQTPSTTTSAIAQQLMQTQSVLDKPTITNADSLYLTLPSNSTIVHQPKLVQAQIQAAPIITKPLIKSTPTEMPALTSTSSTMAVPITQQQPSIAKIQVQAPVQQPQVQVQAPVQQPQVQVQVQQVAVTPQTQQPQTQQTVTTHVVQAQPQQQSTQATTLQEVVDNVVQPRKKKIKIGQIISTQSNSAGPSTSAVTVTTTGPVQSSDAEMYESDAYTIGMAKDAHTDQEQVQYTETGQATAATMKMELPEFINVADPINPDNYELVAENIEEKDDDDQMAQDNIEIESTDMDMSRIFQGTTDEQAKTALMQDTELRFRCSICWKGFKHPMSLTLHKDLHSGKTKCPVCLRSFSRSYDMRIHLNKIHQVTLRLDARCSFKHMKSE